MPADDKVEGENAMRRIINAVFPVMILAIFLFLLFVVLTRAQDPEIVASGGSFVLQKAIVAGGGTEKQALPISENGTTGQSVAGHRSTGASYILFSGFWTPNTLAPTAAMVLVGGRVTTADGRGITNVIVTLTSPSGEVRSARSTAFGYYQFNDVVVGSAYLISVSSRRFTFSQPTQVRTVMDNISDVDFVADAIL